MGIPSDNTGSFIFAAMDVEYALNSHAMTRLSNTNLLFIINDAGGILLLLPRTAFINFHVF